MKPFTKAQRKEFYKKLLEDVCEDPLTVFGFCFYMRYVLREQYNLSYFEASGIISRMERFFPEIWAIKPENKDIHYYWWPNTERGWQTRINKLSAIIDSM